METNPFEASVYLVDDEFPVRDSLTVLLESAGWSIKSFDCARAFLADYDAEKPGCLILDVRMPEMSGLELQEELLKKGINIPIIFISGNADVPDSAKAFRAGAVDFLVKPFDDKVMLERIDEAIKKDIAERKELSEKRRILQCLERLTSREIEVLRLIIHSHSNKAAAKVLQISPRTVEAHRTKVMEKMQVGDITALVNLLAKHNLLGMESFL
ncbi:response regulator transcription factor [Methylomonas sp. MgM2]